MSDNSVQTGRDPYLIYEIKEQRTASWIKVCPERGGIVLSYGARGKELLYLDERTLDDPQAHIRGGIPVLFPICGGVDNETYEWAGKEYRIPNHGVARIHPWEVIATDEQTPSITLRLRSNEQTRAMYPFEFELLFTYSLIDGELHIEQQYRNLSDSPMPMYAGLHPYFYCDSKDFVYETDATVYLDGTDGREKPFAGTVNITQLEHSAFLLDSKTPAIAFQPAGDRRIRMTYSENCKYVILWSLENQPFICVEPWMALKNEMNRKRELPVVEPGQTMHAKLVISCETM